jgi:hypothetical protein
MTLAVLGFLVFFGFYAAPLGGPGSGAFTPATVATHEVEMWQAARAGDEFAAFMSAVALQREQYRLSWFRAVQAGFHVARAVTTFQGLRNRYERVLPDLEAAAGVQKAWSGGSLDPAAVGRAELNWWVTRRLPNLDTLDQVAPLVEKEYELRYGLRPGAAADAATRRAEAALMFDASRTDPNIPAIIKALTDSYESLRRTIVRTAAPSARD